MSGSSTAPAPCGVCGIHSHVRRDPVDIRLRHPEPAGGDRGEVGRHRRALAPHERCPVPVLDPALQRAVGHRGGPPRNRDSEAVGGLVGRIVVAGKPGRRARGLARHKGAVAGRYPAELAPEGIAQGRGLPRYRIQTRNRSSCRRRGAWPDPKLLALTAEARGPAIHPQLRDVEAPEVEVESLQVPRRTCADRGRGPEMPAMGVVAQLEPVVRNVVSAVACAREVRDRRGPPTP